MPYQGRPVPSLCGATRSSTRTGAARGRPLSGSSGPVCAPGGRRIVVSLATLVSLGLAATPAVAQAPDSGTWVGLAGGRMGDVRWSVKVARQPDSARRPCLMVGTKRERGRFDYEGSKYRGCVERTERLAATESPLIVTGAQASAGLKVSLTAVGMVASPAARRIQVTYDDGREATILLREPSPNLEHEARLVHFRYAAFAVPGTWSVERLVTENASGRTLWDSAVGG